MHFLAQSPVHHIMPLVHGEHPLTCDLDLMQVELPFGAGCGPATMYEIADTKSGWSEAPVLSGTRRIARLSSILVLASSEVAVRYSKTSLGCKCRVAIVVLRANSKMR
jgi:hypothetical protein